MASYPNICYTTDIEGDLDHFLRVVHNSKGLTFDGQELHLRDGWMFVHGGDLFDHGYGDVRLSRMLCSLYDRFPDRVVLLLGNRDINKIRFTSELRTDDTSPEQAFGAWWDPKAPVLANYLSQHHLEDTVEHRLRWALQHTLGCPKTFEYRRHELQILLGKQHVSNKEVVDSFIESSSSDDGAYVQYLKRGKLAFRLGATLFVHGAADWRGLGFVPDTEIKFLPNAPENVRGHHVEDLDEWIVQINKFAQVCFDKWRANPRYVVDEAHVPKDGEPYYHRLKRGGDALMAYQNKPAIQNKTVCVHNYLDGKNFVVGEVEMHHRDGFDQRSDPCDQRSLAYLKRAGISRVITGHTPAGCAPASFLLEKDAMQFVAADTNYASDKGRDGSWAEVVIDHSNVCSIHGEIAPTEKYDCVVEAPIGTKVLDDWWVKVRLDSGEFLISRGKGRFEEHKKVAHCF